MSEPKAQSNGKPKYTLEELLATSDYSAPQSPEDREWIDAKPVGREIGSGESEDDKPPKKPDLNQVFEALDKNSLPEDFLSEADRDRSLPQERPELDEMFDESEPMTDEDREWMKREDWEPDYDDEPRSNGNFGTPYGWQTAEEAAAEKKEQAIEAGKAVMRQYSHALEKLAEPTEDEREGMAWWNELDEATRRYWMEKAGNTGRASDAWEAAKRARRGEKDDQPK